MRGRGRGALAAAFLIAALEISFTGRMSVKKSNPHILYIFETQEPYVFF
jgi:hypothetical protein